MLFFLKITVPGKSPPLTKRIIYIGQLRPSASMPPIFRERLPHPRSRHRSERLCQELPLQLPSDTRHQPGAKLSRLEAPKLDRERAQKRIAHLRRSCQRSYSSQAFSRSWSRGQDPRAPGDRQVGGRSASDTFALFL